MPRYIYINHLTGEEIEIYHTMKEVKDPSPELLKKITLKDGSIMKRKITAPTLLGFDSLGRSIRGEEKRQAIKSERRKRNHAHFKKEVLPGLPPDQQKDQINLMKKRGEEVPKL